MTGDERRPSPAAAALLGLVRGYQRTISPLFPPRCRFYPSCSHYAVDALRERGAATGTVLAAYRLLRCNPFARGGVDHVPFRGERWASWDGVVDHRSPQEKAETRAAASSFIKEEAARAGRTRH
ncbi:putative membrane protein insertion efficiency factor [Salana multivorans]|uniref:Putative membrane protein insertion efficiency factor n=1 Tax=Salana multivorans TaxID=120377 RepID=A0A3N2DA49_9MICO|nr:membrane protein insertion efficiency factor YidD [Salana multivorans]MBN8882965.1 membrane protein insertion efficiency factor YidD [Salana multivorans]OJX95328.1 MAG: membrane protein insertion efficiency factor YidD [Micrococcales bacterium 73-15]ROR96669.1 putative membrane protein insertion efficiency factor [Salana multivorans]